MPTTYAKNKVHIYAYVEKNRDNWNDYQALYFRKKRAYNSEVKRLMNILIDL